MLSRSLSVVLGLFLTFSFELSADFLYLPNGERLSGKYLGTQEGFIHFETEYLGVVKAQEDCEVQLTEDTLVMEYIPPALVWPQLEARHYPVTPLADADDLDTIAGDTEPEGFRKLIRSFLPNHWEGLANFGFSRLNSESSVEGLVFSAEAKRYSGPNEYLIGAAYDYSKQVSPQGEESKTIDRYSGRFRWTHNLTDIWSVRTRSIYLKDMLRDINHSATQSVGVGYSLVNEEELEVNVTPAMAGRYIDATGFDQHWLPLATFYENLTYHINGSVRLEQEGNAEYNPGQPLEYAYDIKSGITADVNEWVEAGVFYVYNFDNIVGPDADRVEERILVQLGVPF